MRLGVAPDLAESLMARHHERRSSVAKSKPVTKPIGERNTRQKQAIRDAFVRANRPLSTDEVHHHAQRTSAGLGLATVYRSIRSLLEDGWLSVVDVPGRNPLYEIAGKGHHHHFSCTECSRVYEFEGCATVDAKVPRGFKATGHDLTLFGVCAACNPAARKTAAS